MSKKAIQIADAPAPVGSYSQGILQDNMLFVSGQIPLNPKTGNLEMASIEQATHRVCLLYTSDAADDLLCVDLGGRRIIKKKK